MILGAAASVLDVFDLQKFDLVDIRRSYGSNFDSVYPKTFDLLLFLVQSGGRALSKAELMHALWPDTFVEEANLSFQIFTLRKALGEDGAGWIETIPKHGYRFTASVERPDDEASPPNTPPIRETGRKRITNVWVVAAFGAVAILVLFVGLWHARRMFPLLNETATAAPAVPLTASPGHQKSPSLSPDGNQVAFSWDGPSSENHDIYVKLAGPGEPIRLTTDPANDEQPACRRTADPSRSCASDPKSMRTSSLFPRSAGRNERWLP